MNESYRPEIKSRLKPTKLAKGLGAAAATFLATAGFIASGNSDKGTCSEVPSTVYEKPFRVMGDPTEVAFILPNVKIRGGPFICDEDGQYNNVLTTTRDNLVAPTPTEHYFDPGDPNGPWVGYPVKDILDTLPFAEREAAAAAFKADKDGKVWVNVRQGTSAYPAPKIK